MMGMSHSGKGVATMIVKAAYASLMVMPVIFLATLVASALAVIP